MLYNNNSLTNEQFKSLLKCKKRLVKILYEENEKWNEIFDEFADDPKTYH